jgi:tRNA pseudouridine13 synthase
MNGAPPEVDLQVGMEAYATRGPPCHGKMRVSESDFRVSEVLKTEGIVLEPNDRFLPLYRVEKHGIDTFHMARILSAELRSRISYAGVKDKRAVAIQFVTPTSIHCQRPQKVENSYFIAELVGYARSPISRRMMLGNAFKILIREPCVHVEESIQEAYSTCSDRRLPNYFGLQRFGAKDPVTHKVGKQLVLGKFDEAVRELVFQPRRGEPRSVVEAREKAAAGAYVRAYELLSPHQDLERMVVKRLTRKPEDFIGAFRSLPISIRRFFVHAYSAYLFNRALSEATKDDIDLSKAVYGDNWSTLGSDGLTLLDVRGAKETPAENAVPLAQLAGYAYRDYGSRLDGFTTRVLQEEGVSPKQFYVKEAQEVSAEGGFRRAPLIAKDLGYTIGDEGAHLSFMLARGEYATTILREIIKPEDPSLSGFGS